jgi:uncharacterized protein
VKGRPFCLSVALLVSVGAGCSSAPVHYYTLARPPDKHLPVFETTLAIDVRVIHTPPQLDRSELMVRTGPTQVTLLDNELWASPVSDEIKDALALELRRRLGSVSGLRPGRTNLRVDIDVQRFEAQLGQYALLEASWSATLSAKRSNDARMTCRFQADEKVSGGYAGMVEGYQREIAGLADAIAAVLTNPAGGSDVSCQKSIEGPVDKSP